MKTKLVAFLAMFISNISCFAQNWKLGDSFTQEGITYKVVGYCLVTDPRDTIINASTFYDSGELMVTNISDALTDVVIPVTVGRFQVIGLTDSLFYGKTFNRVWLPELEFIGNSSFENAKIESGTLVVHNIKQVGEKAFHNIDARLCFDLSKKMSFYDRSKDKNDTTQTVTYTKKEKQPKGGVVCHVNGLGHLSSTPYLGYEIAGPNNFFNSCVSEAYGGDKEWIERPLTTKKTELRFCKKSFTTMPSGILKGFEVRASMVTSKSMLKKLPWGHLTEEYAKETVYNVYNKKKHKTVRYDAFKPVANPKLKEGWHLNFSNDMGEENFTLKGKRLKK